MAKVAFNSRKAGIIYILILAVIVILSYGYAAGITGRTKKNGFTAGCDCHGSAPFNNVSVTITGPDTVGPGQTVNFLLNISGGPLVRGGTDIAVSRGILNLISGSGLREIDGELTHEFPKAPSQGSVSFQFSYTAPPAEGMDTIFANGNSVNFDLLPYNDNWNFAQNKILTIKNPIGIISNNKHVVKSFNLEQNYPNPFNPATKIKLSIHEKVYVILSVYDVYGREVQRLIDKELRSGNYEINWNAADYSSGVYIYKIFAGEFVDSKKMIFIK